MIKITVGKKRYKGVYRWDELSLKKYIELSEIKRPDGFDALFLVDSDNADKYIEVTGKVTDEQLNNTFPNYYRAVIGCLTNIPDEVAIPVKEVNEWFECYFKPFVLSLVYKTPVIYYFGKVIGYYPPEIRRFRIGVNYYYLPESVLIMDQVIPLKREPIISYSEASDIFRQINDGAINRLSLFMAIYCRKKNEDYTDDKALEREKLFESLPMSTVWAVFFCTLQHLPEYTNSTKLFGGLRKTTAATVLQVRDYQSLGTEVLYMN